MNAIVSQRCSRGCGNRNELGCIVSIKGTSRVFRTTERDIGVYDPAMVLERDLCHECTIQTTVASIEARQE